MSKKKASDAEFQISCRQKKVCVKITLGITFNIFILHNQIALLQPCNHSVLLMKRIQISKLTIKLRKVVVKHQTVLK